MKKFLKWFLIIMVIGFFIGLFSDDEEETDKKAEAEDTELAEKVTSDAVEKKAKKIADENAEKEKAEKEKAEKEKAKEEEKAAAEKAEKEKAERKAAAEEVEYRGFLTDHSTRFSDVLNQFSDQMLSYSMSDEWMLGTAAIIVEMAGLVDEANEFDAVPDKFKEVHAEYLNGMEQYGIVADGMPVAIDNYDVDHINELTANMEKGTDYILSATDMLDAVINE